MGHKHSRGEHKPSKAWGWIKHAGIVGAHVVGQAAPTVGAAVMPENPAIGAAISSLSFLTKVGEKETNKHVQHGREQFDKHRDLVQKYIGKAASNPYFQAMVGTPMGIQAVGGVRDRYEHIKGRMHDIQSSRKSVRMLGQISSGILKQSHSAHAKRSLHSLNSGLNPASIPLVGPRISLHFPASGAVHRQVVRPFVSDKLLPHIVRSFGQES